MRPPPKEICPSPTLGPSEVVPIGDMGWATGVSSQKFSGTGPHLRVQDGCAVRPRHMCL